MKAVTLSSKSQIVIPRDIRKALRLRAGDKLLIEAVGDRLVILQKPKSFAAALAGLGRGLYPDNYLKKERESWD